MINLSLLIILTLITLILSLPPIIINNKNRENSSPFECGFDPLNKSRTPFSIRFFILTIVFLIFDAEIILLLPIIIIPSISHNINISLTTLFILALLTLGLIHEWNQGALNWVS